MKVTLTSKHITTLKKLVEVCKDAYYKKGRNFKLRLSAVGVPLGPTLAFGRLSASGAVVIGSDIGKKVAPAVLEMTDDRYDFLERLIQTADPNWQPRSGAKADKKTKTKLPVPMSSLKKIYPGDGKLARWTEKFPGPYVVSDKLDGNALEIVYSKEGIKAYTKTSATMGQDVSYLVPHLKIPAKVKGPLPLAVRAETVISLARFQKHDKDNGGKYSFARNMVAGVFNTKGVHEAIADIDVVCHEILESSKAPSAQLAQLKQLGFNVVPHTVVRSLSDSSLDKIFSTRKTKSKYLVDGLVVISDKGRRKNHTGEDPEYAFAFKVGDESNIAQTTVLEVEWNASKHGLAKPRIKIKPVKLAGATVSWVNGHNAFFIEHGYTLKDKAKHTKDMPIGPGAVVEITRSGEVIPYITKVVKAARKPQLPTEKFEYVGNVDIAFVGHQADTTAVKRITALLRDGLGVERMAATTVQRCYDQGMTTVKDFLEAEKEDFLEVPGVKDTLATTYYTQIQKGLKQASEAAVAANSGFFGPLFGTKSMQVILSKYTFAQLNKMAPDQAISAVASLPDFATTSAKAFVAGLPKYLKWVAQLPIRFKKPEATKVIGKKLQGQKVAFTGFRDAALEEYVKQQGGAIASGVSSATTMLLVKDSASGSSKAVKAKAMGIPVLTADQFKSKYGVR